MFKYSIDEYIASKQKEQAEKLIEELKEKAKLILSPEIEEYLNKHRPLTYSYLEGVTEMSAKCDDRIIIPAIPRSNRSSNAQFDLKQGFLLSGKSWNDPIPYIEYSFSEDSPCPHGYDYYHVYLLFFTKYHGYEGSRDCVLHYLDKFDRLKVFI